MIFSKSSFPCPGGWLKTISESALEHGRDLSVDIGSGPSGGKANQAASYYSGVLSRNGLSLGRQESRGEKSAEIAPAPAMCSSEGDRL
jgi:hypothetical protein